MFIYIYIYPTVYSKRRKIQKLVISKKIKIRTVAEKDKIDINTYIYIYITYLIHYINEEKIILLFQLNQYFLKFLCSKKNCQHNNIKMMLLKKQLNVFE